MFLGNSKKEAALDVINYNHLTFDSHIKNICKKSGQKFGALLWITKLIQVKKNFYLNISWNDEISVQLLPFNQDVLLKKSK